VLDLVDEANDLGEEDKGNIIQFVTDLKDINCKIESLLRQKARINWIKLGDSNTKFYHSSITRRRILNQIKGVEVDGVWKEDIEVVRTFARSLFEKRFSKLAHFKVRLGNVDFQALMEEENARVTARISKEEIREAVWQCEGLKSPNRDGFNFNFIKGNWETINEDIQQAIQSFEDTGNIPKGCNCSFIVLVPKIKDPTYLEEYELAYLKSRL